MPAPITRNTTGNSTSRHTLLTRLFSRVDVVRNGSKSTAEYAGFPLLGALCCAAVRCSLALVDGPHFNHVVDHHWMSQLFILSNHRNHCTEMYICLHAAHAVGCSRTCNLTASGTGGTCCRSTGRYTRDSTAVASYCSCCRGRGYTRPDRQCGRGRWGAGTWLAST